MSENSYCVEESKNAKLCFSVLALQGRTIMARNRLTDKQWNLIKDVFPEPASTGRPPVCRRRVMDGILWINRTGSPWRDLPEEFGKWGTVWDLFNTWTSDGTLDEILERLRERIDLDGELWCLDGTIVRAARCANGGGKKKIRTNLLITH
jgi:transposase